MLEVPPEVIDIFSVLVKGSICMMVTDKYRLATKVLPSSTVKMFLLHPHFLPDCNRDCFSCR